MKRGKARKEQMNAEMQGKKKKKKKKKSCISGPAVRRTSKDWTHINEKKKKRKY